MTAAKTSSRNKQVLTAWH